MRVYLNTGERLDGVRSTKTTFDLSRDGDRRAFHEEAVQLAAERGVNYAEATRLLGDRVDLGRGKKYDLDEPGNRQALATAAHARVAASQEEARRTGDPSRVVEFSDALLAVLDGVRRGEIPAGLKAEAAS